MLLTSKHYFPADGFPKPRDSNITHISTCSLPSVATPISAYLFPYYNNIFIYIKTPCCENNILHVSNNSHRGIYPRTVFMAVIQSQNTASYYTRTATMHIHEPQLLTGQIQYIRTYNMHTRMCTVIYYLLEMVLA